MYHVNLQQMDKGWDTVTSLDKGAYCENRCEGEKKEEGLKHYEVETPDSNPNCLHFSKSHQHVTKP